jgi:hypothetical protein
MQHTGNITLIIETLRKTKIVQLKDALLNYKVLRTLTSTQLHKMRICEFPEYPFLGENEHLCVQQGSIPPL